MVGSTMDGSQDDLERFAAIRARRAELATDPGYLRQVLRDGCRRAGEIGDATLDEVRGAMGMRY